MAKLIYAWNVSLDGCTEDARGAFDWAVPDDDFANLAGGGQGRLLPDAGEGVDRQNPARAQLRPGGGPPDEGFGDR